MTSIQRSFFALLEKVVASTQSEIWEFLRSNYGDAIAVEMEGRGLLQAAAHANHQVYALLFCQQF